MRASARAMLLVLMCWSTVSVAASPLSDPTRPWTYQAPAQHSEPSVSHTPVLSSIMIGPRRRIAVINGEVVREGGRVGNMKVMAIEAGRVRLRGPQGYSTLKLLPARVKRAAGKATE